MADLKVGDKVEVRHMLLSQDGLHLGGGVGPYGPWMKGEILSFDKRGNPWVQFFDPYYMATDHRYFDRFDCVRLEVNNG